MKNNSFVFYARLGLLGLGLCILPFVPAASLDAWPSVCLFRNLFGVECPGCGMTRALISLLQGDFTQAMRYNRLSPVVLVLLAWLCAWTLIRDRGRLFTNK